MIRAFHESSASWRPPLQYIAHVSPAGAAPVFIASGMANSGGLNWQEHNPATSSLYAPLTAYPLANRTIPLPYQFSPTVQNFISTQLTTGLRSEPRLFLLAATDSQLVSWMSAHLQTLGYHADKHTFNDYVVVDFRRPDSAFPLPHNR